MSEPNRFLQHELEMISKFKENQVTINNSPRKLSTVNNKASVMNGRGLTDEIRLYIFGMSSTKKVRYCLEGQE
jgi:hypothetical protein